VAVSTVEPASEYRKERAFWGLHEPVLRSHTEDVSREASPADWTPREAEQPFWPPFFWPFDRAVFPWLHNKTALYGNFAKIQKAAGIELACTIDHKHTRFCHVYGFHDLRRTFATMNTDRLTPDALQALMRHKSYSTTQRYIAIAHQMVEAVESLHVPEVLKKEMA